MGDVVLVGVLDARGWLLLQVRDDQTNIDPEKWSLIGGGVEVGETPADAAHRELAEETGIVRDDLSHVGSYEMPCSYHGKGSVDLFAVRSTLTDADVRCYEGRQMVFVAPEEIEGLDLTYLTRDLHELVLGAGG